MVNACAWIPAFHTPLQGVFFLCYSKSETGFSPEGGEMPGRRLFPGFRSVSGAWKRGLRVTGYASIGKIIIQIRKKVSGEANFSGKTGNLRMINSYPVSLSTFSIPVPFLSVRAIFRGSFPM